METEPQKVLKPAKTTLLILAVLLILITALLKIDVETDDGIVLTAH